MFLFPDPLVLGRVRRVCLARRQDGCGQFALRDGHDVEPGAGGVRDKKNFRRERARAPMEMGQRAVRLARIRDPDSLYRAGVRDRVADRARRFQHVDLGKDCGGFWLAEFSSGRDAHAVRNPDRDARVSREIVARAGRRNRLARISRPGIGEGNTLPDSRADQRIDVGGLSLSGFAVRRLQRGRAGLVWAELFHDHGGGGQFYSGVAGVAVAEPLAGGDFSREP